MTEPQLTILIVNFNTADFIKATLFALEKLTSQPYWVYILDNNSRPNDYEKLLAYTQRYNNIKVEREETLLRGEAAHGNGLNRLCAKVITPYFSIIDADATWLAKDWDAILLKRLNDRVKVIGTQAPPGSTKHDDFPVVYIALFETAAFRKLKIDFLPQASEGGVGVGNELKKKYLGAGYAGEVIEMKNTRWYKEGPFRNVICAEYYLDANYDNVFASHFARGSQSGGGSKYTGKFNTGILPYLYRAPFIGEKLLQRRYVQERRRWIKTVYRLVRERAR